MRASLVFHIHQLDFLVTAVNGQPAALDVLRDVVDLPYAQNGAAGEVKVIIPFTNPIMVGRFVFHCHIVGHEDNGMMANLVVLAPGQTGIPPARMRTVQATPRDDFFDKLARWTGTKADPAPAPWADDICRTGDAPPPTTAAGLYPDSPLPASTPSLYPDATQPATVATARR